MTTLTERIPSVLIANRGEIALRIARTCHELGLRSIAIATALDPHPTGERFADEIVALPGATVEETYLNPELLVRTALDAGAAAIHPGYGFLSENADFADLVTEAGLAFIGPPGRVIELVGDKIRARQLAIDLDVPVLQGSSDVVEDVAAARAFGDQHGYPVAVKAVHGGGGRGMRFVASEDELASALESAWREAAVSFGRRACFVEKALAQPRHVEVQVFVESDGTIRILGDRDCTLQRRHQKLIEECPAPGLPDQVRDAIHAHSRRLVEAIGYVNAGTCEFLLDPASGAVFFLEINARLQVEHPVTEAVFGIDLVAAQILAAAGLPSDLGKATLNPWGHAVEVRVNAEVPAEGFLPSTGTIARLSLPGGPGVRLDLGFEPGSTVSTSFDPLIGKLVCWGPTRDSALDRAVRAIEEFRIEGVETGLAAARLLLMSDAMRSVKHHTGTVESLHFAESVSSRDPTRIDSPEPQGDKRWPVVISGRRFDIAIPGGLIDDPRGISLTETLPAFAPAGATRSRPEPVRAGLMVSPMSGTVVKANYSVGQHVSIGEPAFVLEAMKMEIEVRAPTSGILVEVLVAVGDSVDRGTLLGELAIHDATIES